METTYSDAAAAAVNGGKREREEEVTAEASEDGNGAKKPKVDEKSVEEQRLEKDAAKSGPVAVGHKSFETSVQIFDYFFKFLHFWPPNLNVNKVHIYLFVLISLPH